MSTANRVIKNTGFLYAKMGITMFISLYTTRLILNSLGASDFGIFNIVGGAISMLGFLNAAMASATQRFMSYSEGEGNKEKQKSIFNVSIILHFCISLLVGILLFIAGHFFFNGMLNIPQERILAAKVIYGSLIISTMFTIMSVPYDAAMNAHENMKYYAIIGVFESLLRLLIAFICVYTHYDKLIIYGVLMACVPLFLLTIMRIYCHKNYEECTINPRKYWNKQLIKEMTSFAGWNFISSMITMCSAYGQGLILNHFFGTLLNAAQGIASQLNGQLQVLSSNMLKAINPILGKSAGANDSQLLLKSTMYGAKYASALYLLIAIPMFIETPYILQLWLKNVPEWTAVFVRFQLIKTFIEFQFSTLPRSISATGKIKEYSFYSSISNILQIPAIYIFFKFGFPPYFMYISTIIFGNVIVYLIAFYYSTKLYNLSPSKYIKFVLLPLYLPLLTTLTLTYAAKYLFVTNNILNLSITIILSISIFGLLFFRSTSKEEKVIFINIKEAITNKIKKYVNK